MAKKGKRKGLLGFVYMIAGLTLIVVTFTGFMQITGLADDVQVLTEKKEALLFEQASLESEIALLNDDDYVTRYARENYVFTREGEQVAIIPQIEE